jgi:hypothetical protein
MNSQEFNQIVSSGFSDTESHGRMLKISTEFNRTPEELESALEEGIDFSISEDQEERLKSYLEHINRQIEWIDGKDEGELAQIKSTAENLRIFIQNFKQELKTAVAEDYELEDIASALNDQEIVEEAEMELEKLQKMKKRLEEIMEKGEKAEKYADSVNRLEAELGSLNQIENALDNRKRKIEILLKHADEGEKNPRRSLLETVLEIHSANNLYRMEKEALRSLDDRPEIQNLSYSIFCPTILSESGSSYKREKRREDSLAAFVLLLNDLESGDKGSYKFLKPENDIEFEKGSAEQRQRIAEVYGKMLELHEDDGFDLIEGDYEAFYVRPGEYDLSNGELVISKVPGELLSGDIPRPVLRALEPKIADSGDVNLRATIFHEFTHHFLRERVGDGVDWDRSDIAAIDEGAAYAVTYLMSGESHIDSRTYRNLYGIEEGKISSISEALIEEQGNDISAIRNRAISLIREIEGGNDDALQEFLNDS